MIIMTFRLGVGGQGGGGGEEKQNNLTPSDF